jgi:hypothetical protein
MLLSLRLTSVSLCYVTMSRLERRKSEESIKGAGDCDCI